MDKIIYDSKFKNLNIGSLCPLCEDEKLNTHDRRGKARQDRSLYCSNCTIKYYFKLDKKLKHRDKLYCISFTNLSHSILKQYDKDLKGLCPVCLANWHLRILQQEKIDISDDFYIQFCPNCKMRFKSPLNPLLKN